MRGFLFLVFLAACPAPSKGPVGRYDMRGQKVGDTCPAGAWPDQITLMSEVSREGDQLTAKTASRTHVAVEKKDGHLYYAYNGAGDPACNQQFIGGLDLLPANGKVSGDYFIRMEPVFCGKPGFCTVAYKLQGTISKQ